MIRRRPTARPHIPRHIPGYDLYLWIDSDAWLQDWQTVQTYLEAASRVGAAFTPEIDRSYLCFYDKGQGYQWKYDCYDLAFGKETAERLAGFPLINSGVFAATGKSPLWSNWQNALRSALQRSQDFYVEQTAANFAIYGGTPCAMLPSTCNWHCSFGRPKLEAATGQLLSHLYPKTRIGIVHLCGGAKNANPLTLDTDTGETRVVDLRYPRWEE